MTKVDKTRNAVVAGRSLISENLTVMLVILTPALTLIGYWVGGETVLTLTALTVPIAASLLLISTRVLASNSSRLSFGMLSTSEFEAAASSLLDDARHSDRKSAVLAVEIDDFNDLTAHYGAAAIDIVKHQLAGRIRASVRQDDLICSPDEARFDICLTPQVSIDLEICLELAGRIASAVSEPYSVDGTSIYLTCSIGICQLGREISHEASPQRDPVLPCAHAALQSAKTAAHGSIRAFSRDMKERPISAQPRPRDAENALETGEIVPWFQPQISTDTGKITGFEALARWVHPKHGPISPGEFIPQLEEAGKMPRLSEVMLYNALTAIRAWDQAGADVQQVGVNFSSAELSDPRLVEKIAWELDRFELAPHRLCVEILETVVAKGPDDVITRNINGLNALGCRIDLDDFGTGHASLNSIRRFGVNRIKIDRSFVMKSDRDPDQQRMIRAILTMAEKLDLETLAEGVETVGEHSLLAQLGCTHVQGFGIGRPMPFDQTLDWINGHNAKLQAPPEIPRAAG